MNVFVLACLIITIPSVLFAIVMAVINSKPAHVIDGIRFPTPHDPRWELVQPGQYRLKSISLSYDGVQFYFLSVACSTGHSYFGSNDQLRKYFHAVKKFVPDAQEKQRAECKRVVADIMETKY